MNPMEIKCQHCGRVLLIHVGVTTLLEYTKKVTEHEAACKLAMERLFLSDEELEDMIATRRDQP